MARKNITKKQKTWITVGAAVLGAVVLVGAVAGVAALANGKEDDGFKRVNVGYEVGGLTDVGVYEKSEYTLYTKNGFDVEGKTVSIDINFDANITYQLFFYDENDEYIADSATDVLTVDYKADAPTDAVSCRIEITPVWDEDVKDDDKKIDWFEKVGYTSQLTVSVADIETETEDSSAA